MLGTQNSWFVTGFIEVPGVQNFERKVNSLGVANRGTYTASRDSILNSVSYKVFENSTGSPFFNNNVLRTALVREDTITRKIYMVPKDSTVERLVLDFSLQTGDSIFLSFPGVNNYYLKTGYYFVDSVKQKPIAIGLRKHLYLTEKNGPVDFVTGKKYFLEWIESVGAVHFPINCVDMTPYGGYGYWRQLPQWSLICRNQQFGHFVSCKTTNAVYYYKDTLSFQTAFTYTNYSQIGNDVCNYLLIDYGSGISDANLEGKGSVFPNPATDFLQVHLPELAGDARFEIYDASGAKLQEADLADEREIKLSTVNYLQGVYLIRMSTNRGTVQLLKFTVSK